MCMLIFLYLFAFSLVCLVFFSLHVHACNFQPSCFSRLLLSIFFTSATYWNWKNSFFFQVSKLGFGCMGLTGIYSAPLPEEDGIAVIKYAFERGITLFDTADVYGTNSSNEVLVGKV
ncbi:hypothetical protein AMTRI_Chr03g55000 [Amborella trichopoda]